MPTSSAWSVLETELDAVRTRYAAVRLIAVARTLDERVLDILKITAIETGKIRAVRIRQARVDESVGVLRELRRVVQVAVAERPPRVVQRCRELAGYARYVEVVFDAGVESPL